MTMRLTESRLKIVSVALAFLLAGMLCAAPARAAGQLASDVYTIDRTNRLLTGVKAGTPLTELIAGMNNDPGSLSVLDSEDTVITDGNAATGMTLRLTEGGETADSLAVVVSGDADGDGCVTTADYTLVRLDLLGKKALSGAYRRAGDVGGNGTLGIGDYTQLRLAILGLCELGEDTLPLAGMLIGLDPGHQRKANSDLEPMAPGSSVMNKKVTSGTQGRFTGVPEYVVNLQVGLKLRDELEALGAAVIMTRTTHDIDISNSERAKMMNKAGVDCWLRIHADGSDDSSVYGISILVPAAGTMNTSDAGVQQRSAQLAGALLDSVVKSTKAKSRGLKYRSDQTGFCWSSVPVCNIEMGYMTNEAEDKLLVTDAYQNKIVDGLVDGFLKYFE